MPEEPLADPNGWLESQPLAGYRLMEVKRDRPESTLYLAEDLRRGHNVAIKTIRPHPRRDDAVARFFEEARTVARLRHPAVARAFDAGRQDDLFWFARAWVRGESLADRLARRERGRLSERETLALARGVAEALRGLFEHGLAHRRLTAGNIFFAEGGSADLFDAAATPAEAAPDAPADDDAEVGAGDDTAEAGEGEGDPGAADGPVADDLDLMVEQLLARKKDGATARTASIMLTGAGLCMELAHADDDAAVLAYADHAAPEQAAGDPVIDIRADLYALGSLWHTALMGHPPFKGDPAESLRRRMEETPTSPREADPRVSFATSRLIDWLLATEREDRPRTPQDFLAKFAQHPALAAATAT